MYGKGGKTSYGKGAFKVRTRKADREPWHGPKPFPAETQAGGFLVQGRKASDLEARVYRALRRLGWDDSDIEFQTPIMGGRMPGGAVLDFVVWTPSPVVVEVNGDYWHNRDIAQQQKIKDREAKIREAWSRPFKYINVGTGEIMDDGMTYNRMLLDVGRGG